MALSLFGSPINAVRPSFDSATLVPNASKPLI